MIVTYYMSENSAPLTARVSNGNFSFTKIPTRELYVFTGMFDQPSGGSMIIDENGKCLTYIDKPLTLYAHWTPKSYTVSFAQSDEYVLSGNFAEFTIAAGDTILYDAFPIAVNEGYEFSGWFAGNPQIADGAAIREDKKQLNEAYLASVSGDKIVLSPNFRKKTFTVTFDLNYGGATQNPESLIFDYFNNGISEEHYPSAPQNVEGKEFIGWSVRNDRLVKFEGPVRADVTIYAVWRSSVTEEIDMGDGGLPQEVKINEDAANDYVPERNGYECVGCFTDKSYAGSASIRLNYYAVKENAVYYAKFAVKEYNITFQTNCQTALSGITYDIERQISLPDNLEKEHYTFVGWCLNEDLSDAPVKVLKKGNYGDKILYAKFKGDDIKVVLSENSSERNSVIEYGSKTVGLPRYTGGSGYVFYGWYDRPDGGERLSDEYGMLYEEWTDAADGAVLYARYERKYYVNLSSNIPSVTEFVGVKDYYLRGNAVEIYIEIDLPDIYSLVCVRNKDSGEETLSNVISFVMGEADYNFEIIIEAKSFNVKFDYGDAWCKTDSQTVTYGEIVYLPVAVKSGYDFDGWLYGSQKITDKNGRLLEMWTITENVTLSASFVTGNNTYIKITDENSLRGIFGNPSAKYYLANDITLTGDWTPADFAATLDGNGYRIINLNASSASGNLGMFLNLSGTVKNLVLENLNVVSTSYNKVNVGGLCAILTGTVENVELKSGSIVCEYGDIGGIAGTARNSAIIKNCINRVDLNGNLNEGDGSTGGMAGVSEGSIVGCENYGTVSGSHNTAGIAGFVKGLVSDCTNYGTINGKNHTGGITGHIPGAAALSNLINEGEVTGTDYVGGIFSLLTASQNVTYNAQLTNRGKVTGKDYVGGIGGSVYFYTSVNGSTGSTYTYTLTLSKMTNSGEVQ
ncbi:MAG: InlB B-repeat-containing protein, partial [Clostridia bacterium]|nr:InlB B-repeat-containing protein [Clostridia bacterium]